MAYATGEIPIFLLICRIKKYDCTLTIHLQIFERNVRLSWSHCHWISSAVSNWKFVLCPTVSVMVKNLLNGDPGILTEHIQTGTITRSVNLKWNLNWNHGHPKTESGSGCPPGFDFSARYFYPRFKYDKNERKKMYVNIFCQVSQWWHFCLTTAILSAIFFLPIRNRFLSKSLLSLLLVFTSHIQHIFWNNA